MTDTRAYQHGAEIIRTESTPSTRAYQHGAEIIYRPFTLDLPGLGRSKVLGALAIAGALGIPGLARARVLGTPSVPRTIQVEESSRTRVLGEVYVTDRNTFVLPGQARTRALGPPALQPRLSLLSIARTRALGEEIYVVPEGSIITDSLVRVRKLSVATLEHVDQPRTLRMRVTSAEYGSPGIIKAKLVDDDLGNYPVNPDMVGGSAAPGNAPGIAGVPGSTKLVLMDAVLLRDEDDAVPVIYAAVSGYNPAWHGTLLSKSGDGGASWDDVLIIQEESIIGYAVTALGSTSRPEGWDYVNTVRIQLLKPAVYQLQSESILNVYNGANSAALIKSNGEVEIFQYLTATEVSAGVYELSTLLRGRRGSDYAVAGHAVGDRFVLLDAAKIKRITVSTSEIGLARLYKATSSGTAFEDAMKVSFTHNGSSLKPLSPVHIEGTRDGSNNLTVTCVRRTRVSQEWRDKVDVPLGEASLAFEWDFLNGSGAVVRTKSTTVESVSYPAAEQTADGLTPGNPVSLRVHQISAIVGRGFPGSATV